MARDDRPLNTTYSLGRRRLSLMPFMVLAILAIAGILLFVTANQQYPGASVKEIPVRLPQ